MTDKEWLELCDRAYETAAAQLVADGWERHNRTEAAPSPYPATFHKDGQVRILTRKLASSTWHPARLPGTV